MMTVSDWISIICAGVALIVTIVIAILQIRQSNRMEKFEKRQDKRDEQRHQESVKAQAVSFINKILYLIFDYPHKHYTFKYFAV